MVPNLPLSFLLDVNNEVQTVERRLTVSFAFQDEVCFEMCPHKQ